MGMTGVVTSDWHLGGMTSVFDNPTPYQMAEIHKPFKYALANGIANVFVPGDVSDKAQLDDTVFMQLIQLLLTYDGKLNVHLMIGNHDVEDKHTTSMALLSFLSKSGLFKTTHVHTKTWTSVVDGVDVCMLPWPNKQVKSKTGKPPVVFAHVETPGALGDNGLPLKTKKEHINRMSGDYVISGHIHAHQILPKKRWAFCGNPYQKNFGEAMPKGFVVFSASYSKDGALKVSVEHINSKPAFKLETIEINDNADFDSLSDDHNTRYKLLIDKQSGIVIPQDLATRYPNIVSINGNNSLKSVATEVLKSQVNDMPTFTPMTGLVRFLKEAGAEKNVRLEAVALVKEAIASLGMSA